jgi:spermidine/putrescine transport system permease protein
VKATLSAWFVREWLFRVLYWGFVFYLFLPLALIVLMSFKDSPFIGFPVHALTLHWYSDVLQDSEVSRAFTYSLAVALISTGLAVVVGTWTAVALLRLELPLLVMLVFGAACIPLVTPGIISAISMRMFIRVIGVAPGPAAIVLSHATHAAPLVVIMVTSRLRAMPKSLVEAAWDLGANSRQTFVRVTLPYIAPAIFGAAMLALLSSFDDFLRSFFLGDYNPTLPVLIFARIRNGLSPQITALATAVLVLTGLVGLGAERQVRRERIL